MKWKLIHKKFSVVYHTLYFAIGDFFFHIYTILCYILRKKQWKPGCQSTFLLRKI